MAVECKYNEVDWHLKEKFIYKLNDDGMIVWNHAGVCLSNGHQLSKK